MKHPARWPDGSIRWLLVDFPISLEPSETANLALEFGREVTRSTIDETVIVDQTGPGVAIDTGAIRVDVGPRGRITQIRRGDRRLLADRAACETAAMLAEGAGPLSVGDEAQITVEQAGPIRAVVQCVSDLHSAAGGQPIRVIKRIEATRGSPAIRVHHTVVMLEGDPFLNIESMHFDVPLANPPEAWQVARVEGEPIRLDAGKPRAWQRTDRELLPDDAADPVDARIIGGAVGAGGDGFGYQIAVRDAWQNYPKGFAVTPRGLRVELMPAFEPGYYDQFPFEKEGHHLFYYLLDGRYRLKQGVSKTHEMLLSFAPAAEAQHVATAFQRPPLAVVDPAWVGATEALFEMAPRDEDRFPHYEATVDRAIEDYAARIERSRDYGLHNFGDWYGERGTNWGNIEYDTQHVLLQEFLRSGNREAFFLAHRAELHNRDVDTVQYHPDPDMVGAVYTHQMCHVGGYYDKAVPGSLGYPGARPGGTVTHAWAEGHFEHYFLTGDPRSFDTGLAVVDFFTRKELSRPYDFHVCRQPGWYLIMLAGAYQATADPYYLNAARVVADRVFDAQDVDPRPLPAYQAKGRQPYQQGGWSRMMRPGHCKCLPRHRGNAGFMVGILLSGLKYYGELSGDPRANQAIVRGAHYLLDETYDPESGQVRYTSCPKHGFRRAPTLLLGEGIARAYRISGEERFRQVLVEALPRGLEHENSFGKTFSFDLRCGPRTLADLKAVGIGLKEPAEKKD